MIDLLNPPKPAPLRIFSNTVAVLISNAPSTKQSTCPSRVELQTVKNSLQLSITAVPWFDKLPVSLRYQYGLPSASIAHLSMYLPLKQVVPGLDPEQFEKLKQLALKARALSYSPYSQFRVGCCLLTREQQYYTGANVENASYGGTVCAERTTIVKAITSKPFRSDEKPEWMCLAIAGDSLETCISPCGICRQFLREFAEDDFPVVMFNGDGSKVLVKTLKELLPLSFGPGDLVL